MSTKKTTPRGHISDGQRAAAQQEETDFEATHRDEFDGQGGSYEIRDGKRVLVHRTAPEGTAAE